MDHMKEQQVEVEKTLTAHKEAVQSMPKIQTEMKRSAQELKRIVETKEDRDVREVNIIIHNIPESQSDEPTLRQKYDSDSFQNITHALLGEDVNIKTEKIYRLGKKKEDDSNSKPRLMLVRLKKKEDVEVLMRKRWDLPKVGFNNIYLTRDLPPEERELQRKLREELKEKGKETHRIFRGKVIPRNK